MTQPDAPATEPTGPLPSGGPAVERDVTRAVGVDASAGA